MSIWAGMIHMGSINIYIYIYIFMRAHTAYHACIYTRATHTEIYIYIYAHTTCHAYKRAHIQHVMRTCIHTYTGIYTCAHIQHTACHAYK